MMGIVEPLRLLGSDKAETSPEVSGASRWNRRSDGAAAAAPAISETIERLWWSVFLMVHAPAGRVTSGSRPPDLSPWASEAIQPELCSEARKACHVLFVDDDLGVRETIAELLRMEGLTVTEVDSGRAALDLLRRDETITFLLSDFSMPEMDGIEVARAAREIRPLLPVAILTGYAAQAERLKSMDLKIFRKPADPEPIARYIERLVSSRSA